MKTKQDHEKASSSTESAESISVSTKEADALPIQEEIAKEVKIVGMNEHHRTIIIKPKGYQIGDSAKCPLIVNPDFEFTVTGEEIQLVTV